MCRMRITRAHVQEAVRLLAVCPRLQAETGYSVGMKCLLLRSHGVHADDVAGMLSLAPAFFTWRGTGAHP